MSVRGNGAGCVICGRKPVEHHHVGGRNHIAWFTMPLCVEHHAHLHELLPKAGVKLEYTSDSLERFIRARKAIMILDWMLTEALQQLNSKKSDK